MASTLVAIDSDGNKFYLDVLKNQPITADFKFKDITDLKTKGSHTYNFRLPSTPTNDSYFSTYFMTGSYCANDGTNGNFNPYFKADAYLIQDTIEVFSGYLQLVNVFLRDGNNYEYEVILYSADVSLMDSLKGVKMSDLDFTDYDHAPTTDNIYDSYASNSIANGDVVYSFFDYGTGMATSQASEFFVPSTTGFPMPQYNKIDINFLRPQIRLSALLDRILEHKGYTYSSSFFSGTLGRKIYCDINYNGGEKLTSLTPESYYKVKARNTSTQLIEYGSTVNILNTPTEDLDLNSDFDPTTNEYTIPFGGIYQYTIRATLNGETGSMGSSSPARFGIYLKTGANTYFLITYAGNQFNIGSGTTQTCTAGFDTTVPITLPNGGGVQMGGSSTIVVRLITETNTAYPVGDNIEITNASIQVDLISSNFSAEVINFNQLFGNLKAQDLLSSIIRKFNLTVIPDKTNSKHLFIEPYNDYMSQSRGTKDWSEKIDFTKDVQIIPPSKISGRNALFKDTPSDDYVYQATARSRSFTIGEYDYNIGNEFSETTNHFTSVFSPTINYPVQNAGIYSSAIITVDADGYKNVGGIRLSFYHGIKTVLDDLKYRLYYDNGTVAGDNKYNLTVAPNFSAFSETGFEESDTVFTINWGCTFAEQLGLWEQIPLQGLASKYWLSYLRTNFDKNARMLTAYMRLSPSDIQDFQFNDVIHLNGDDYIVNSIKGYNINSTTICKVELLKTYITFGSYPPEYDPIADDNCPDIDSMYILNGYVIDTNTMASLSEYCCGAYNTSVGGQFGFYYNSLCFASPQRTVPRIEAPINNNVRGVDNSFNFEQGGSIQGNRNQIVNGGRDIKVNGNENVVRSAVSKVDITGDNNIVLDKCTDVTIIGKGNIVRPATDDRTINVQTVLYNNSLKNIRITGDYGLALNNNEVIVSTSQENLVGTSQTAEHIIRTTVAGGSRDAWIGQLGAFDTYPVGTTYNSDLGINAFRLPAKTLITLTITLQATTGTTNNTTNNESWETVREYKILSGTAPIVLSSNTVSQTQSSDFNTADIELHPSSNIPYLYNSYLLWLRLPFSTLVNDSTFVIKTKYSSSVLSGTVTSNVVPTDITGCVLWLDSANFGSLSFNSTVGNAQPITEWYDRSGGNNHVLQNNVTYMPLWYSGAGVGGGRPYLYFDGTTSVMFNTDADLLNLATGDNTFIVVFESDITTNETFGQVVAGINTSTGLPRAGVSINNSSTYGGAGADSVSFYNENTFSNMFQCNISSAGVTDKKIVVGRRDNADLDIIDENGNTDTYTTASSPTDAFYFTVGGRWTGSVDYAEFKGRIHEIIAYDNKISDADRDKLIFYLKNKWNIQ
jgi:hypothetical protein